MKAFFHTIILVVGFTFLIICYYSVKASYKRLKLKQNKYRRKQFNILKRQKLNQNFFSALINKVNKREILWFEVFCEEKIEKRMFIQKIPTTNEYSVGLNLEFIQNDFKAEFEEFYESTSKDFSGEYKLTIESEQNLIKIFNTYFDNERPISLKFKF